MLLFQKNGISFVTELVWQRANEEHYINLRHMKTQCGFDLYCALNTLSPTFGFVRLPKSNLERTRKTPQPILVSLASFVILSSGLAKRVEDMFICFRFDEKRFGYIFINKNSIFPENGEYIGDLETIKERMINLSREYGAKSVRVFADVPLANDAAFAARIGLKIVTVNAIDIHNHPVNEPASDYYLWNHNASFASRIEAASLRTFSFWQPKQKKTASISLMIIVAISSIIFIGKFVYQHLDKLKKKVPSIANVTYIPLETSGVPAPIFLDQCFNNIDTYLQAITGWHLGKLSCSLTTRNIDYETQGGLQQTLLSTLSTNNIKFTNKQATVSTPLNFPKQKVILPSILQSGTNAVKTVVHDATGKSTTANSNSITATTAQTAINVDNLNAYANAYNLLLDLHNLPTVEITSNYSPIYLYYNNVLDNMNIFEITMQINQGGFYVWHIKGKFNDKN